ncbi:hypothetical protein KUTeg_001663 [Tegillarca granosa]|uniref:TNFR-Cys domain-containing protein n=1 Tax=Tegillarca granosa TaxID=220873 RepID=A0ABQ9FS38_TEGGR|nr:hypothetical protein KUTeg_001663 [Tegillarca granosa]
MLYYIHVHKNIILDCLKTCLTSLMAVKIQPILLVFGMVFALSEALICQQDTYNFNGSHCCSKCKPGFGLASNCSDDHDTVCESCIEGQTFSSNEAHSSVCKPCTVCKTHFHTLTSCNKTHDTVCECDAYFYFNDTENQCQLCTLCNVGYGAVVPCTSRQNSVCIVCQNGTYSDVKSATSACRKCSECKKTQIVLKHCTHTEDTLCIGFDIIPLYCAILGAVVVGLLGYVLFKNYTRIKAKERHKDNQLTRRKNKI